MKIINKISNLDYLIDSSVLTIGTFDGMHKGHRYLINQLSTLSKRDSSQIVLITFTPNPYIVLNNIESKDYHIINREKKYNIIKDMGVDILFEINFDENIAKMSAYDFLSQFIVKPFSPTDIIVGHDHHFGNNREGNADFLKQHQAEFRYKLHIEKPFGLDKETISSSLLRKLITDGDILTANKYLGRYYEFSGVITSGSKIGREISFPTANISPVSIKQLVPGNGVYFIKGYIENECYHGMCNIGFNPTFSNEREKMIEVHLFNYNKYDLYDKYITIEFVDYIRSEKKFDNKEDLKQQLEKDKEYCKSILN